MTDTGVDAYATVALDLPGSRHATLSTGLRTRTPITAAIGGSDARIEIAAPFFGPSSITLAETVTILETLDEARRQVGNHGLRSPHSV